MAFGDLTVRSAGVLLSEATSTPSDGDNTIDLGFTPENSDWVTVSVYLLGPSITDVSLTSLSGSTLVLNFTQTGTDQATIIVREDHTLIR